ncbi:hypothetical protein KCP74_03655 [Salmonella enterica subsp. enterica]|nr:hypothetical protein KCP74_03655 [Salmonella enterica subsp. enterica]
MSKWIFERAHAIRELGLCYICQSPANISQVGMDYFRRYLPTIRRQFPLYR